MLTRTSRIEYVELQAHSNFSLLRGASHPEELVQRATELGYQGIAITDCNSVGAVVRAHTAAKNSGGRFIVAAEITLSDKPALALTKAEEDPPSLLLYPTSRKGYGNLCRLLTLGKLRAEKGGCTLCSEDFFSYQEDLVCSIVPHWSSVASDIYLLDFVKKYREKFNRPELLSLTLSQNFSAQSEKLWRGTIQVAEKLSIPLVATGNVYYHTAERRPLQDVLRCIRLGCSVAQAGFELYCNAERYLKPLDEIVHIFRHAPEALRRSLEIAEYCRSFSLDCLRYEYPEEICPPGLTPMQHLIALSFEGAKRRYPDGIPDKVRTQLCAEFKLIEELRYEKYFLTCYDIVCFARSRGILCQGRGAAANSVVCFCLGITEVDPARINLLFARFISKERDEPPDIDIDFEHERREEVIQYIYQRFGRERSGLTCEVITYRARSAIRDVGKALGLPLDSVDLLANLIHRWTGSSVSDADLKEAGLSPDDKTIRNALLLAEQIQGFPRHLSQHVGGFIISEKPLCETVPILNAAMPDRTIIEWDKDDIEELGMLKIDILGLGMLSCIRKALTSINETRALKGEESLTLATIPAEDPAVYDMLCAADTVGVFQVESRAQMSMLPRLKPRCFYDLVIEVAIVRPGPIQGNMVHPYLRRRKGLETPNYPDSRVEAILGKTLGVPLFQEQAMQLAIVLANFTPGEAEQLRRSMASWKRNLGVIAKFKEKIINGMISNGYSPEFAESCMNQIRGFSEYGFPESHAASFALLVYASAWIKRHYPAHFASALINSQPMGFYAPSQIVRDAEQHRAKVLPIDVNRSQWDCTLPISATKNGYSSEIIQLGFRLVKGLRKEDAMKIAAHAPYSSIYDLWNKIKIQRRSLELLAKADAFQSMNLASREALWQIRALKENLGTMEKQLGRNDSAVTFARQTLLQQMFQDYSSTGLSLKAHPLQFIREELQHLGVIPAAILRGIPASKQQIFVSVAGISIMAQRPQTARGVVFITLEDETGVANLIVRPQVFERYQKVILSSSILLAHGALERVEGVIYISATKLEKLDRHRQFNEPNRLPVKSYSY